jgi:uncharacterized damage-inducible protein DinB
MDFVNSLQPGDLRRKMKDQRKGQTLELRQMLLHMVEEELQHRGEMNALLWQMDVDPPIVSFDDYLRKRKLPIRQ